jgi:hypothetical protein
MRTYGVGGLRTVQQAVLAAAPARRPATNPADELVLIVRDSKHVQTERIQAVVDGAVLAVEQMQDVRLEVIEKGPEVTVSDVAFDLFIGLCFGVAGKALVPVTESIATELVKTATWYGRLGGNRPLFKGLRLVASLSDEGFAQEWQGTLTAGRMKAYNDALRAALITGATEQAANLTESALDKGEELATGGSLSPLKRVDIEATDSPAVAVLGAAQSYSALQRAAIAAYHDAFELLARVEPTAEIFDAIRQATTNSDLGADLIEIRDRHKLLFEAVMWTKLFGLDRERAWRSGNVFDSGVELTGVTRPVLDYWTHRFARLVERWLNASIEHSVSRQAVQNETGIDPRFFGYRGPKVPLEQGAFENPVPIPGLERSFNADSVRRSSVVTFMAKITDELNKLEGGGVGAGGFTVSAKAVGKPE